MDFATHIGDEKEHGSMNTTPSSNKAPEGTG